MIEPVVVPLIWLIFFSLLSSTMPTDKTTELTINQPEIVWPDQ